MKTILFFFVFIFFATTLFCAQTIVKKIDKNTQQQENKDFFGINQYLYQLKNIYEIAPKDSVKQQNEFKKNNATAERKSKKK